MYPSWRGGPRIPAPHSALSAAYARLNRAFPGPAVMEVGVGGQVPTGGGRVSAASLAEGGVDLDTFLTQDEAQVLRDHGVRARPDVVASFGPNRYARPARPLITAAPPGARLVDGEEAPRGEARAAVAEHPEPVLAGFGPRTRRPGRGAPAHPRPGESPHVLHRAPRGDLPHLPARLRRGPGRQAVGRRRELRHPHAHRPPAVP